MQERKGLKIKINPLGGSRPDLERQWKKAYDEVMANGKDRTTREHYEKYRDMCQERGFAIADLSYFVNSGTIEQLAHKYWQDDALNSIPLRLFDALWYAYRAFGRAAGMSQAEYCCCMKHLLIYDVLGLEPEFYDTYQDILEARRREKWYGNEREC